MTSSTRATHSTHARGDDAVFQLLKQTLAYGRRRDYRGSDFGDGMSSRLLRAIPVESKWLNISFQEAVKRAPVDIRDLLAVERRRNFKGTALFAMANRNLHLLTDPDELSPSDPEYVADSRSLLEWLLDNQCQGYSGFCGGHQHRLQHLNGRIGEPNDPDVVSTSYAVRALLSAPLDDERYADVARSAARFVVEDLDYRPVEDGAIINYHLNHGDEHYTINAGALGARIFLDLYARFDDPEYLHRATELLDHIAGLQMDIGGWTYRDPPETSHLSMDSHHNGFVVECFQRYAEVVDGHRYDDTVQRAMSFYRSLFDDGAPDFDEQNAYPRDIHAATQGILVFSYAGEFDRARGIIRWAVENLYGGDGRFYFRKHRFYTQRVTLMRWCQAWMAYALSEYLRVKTTPATEQVPEAALLKSASR